MLEIVSFLYSEWPGNLMITSAEESRKNKSFLSKINTTGRNFYTSVSTAYEQKILNLNDKKRCCLIATNFTLADCDKQARWMTAEEKMITKPQWFHSAFSLYILLSRPGSASKDSFIVPIIASDSRETFLKIAKDVLVSNIAGTECIAAVDSGDLLLTIDDRNKSVSLIH